MNTCFDHAQLAGIRQDEQGTIVVRVMYGNIFPHLVLQVNIDRLCWHQDNTLLEITRLAPRNHLKAHG